MHLPHKSYHIQIYSSMKNWKFLFKMVLAKSALVLNNVFPAADIIFFHPNNKG